VNEPASAEPDVDYATMGRRVESIPAGMDRTTLYVPIISNPQRRPISQFYVAIGAADDAAGATLARTTVTIDRGD